MQKSNVISFRKVGETFGWLSNMAPYNVTYDGKEYRTTEALYQCLKFAKYSTVQNEIRSSLSPICAKMKAKKYCRLLGMATNQSDSDENIQRMKLCLKLKLDQHPELQEKLLQTQDALLIEDCTGRQRGSAKFWGAVETDGDWNGLNMLGKLWMELREELKKKYGMCEVN